MNRPLAPWQLLLLGVVACAPYQSGQVFEHVPLGGSADRDVGDRRFQCLDLHIEPSLGRGRAWIPIRYRFGNPCRHAADIDLSSVRVRATLGDAARSLPVYDPRGEIAPAQIDARMRAEETIAYEIPPSWVGERLHVCVILDAVAPYDSESMPSFCFEWESN